MKADPISVQYRVAKGALKIATDELLATNPNVKYMLDGTGIKKTSGRWLSQLPK